MWARIKRFFLDSETIFLARLQLVVGVLFAGIAYADWSILLPLLKGEFNRDQVIAVALFIAFNGIVTEIARRRRDPELKQQARR